MGVQQPSERVKHRFPRESVGGSRKDEISGLVL